jgi:glycosyltransferase involved in cell wall biosynthesis
MTQSNDSGVEPRHFLCSLLDGLPYDLLVRQAEFVLQLAQVHCLEIEGGRQVRRRPWWELLSATQQELFASLLDIRRRPAANFGSQEQRDSWDRITAARRIVLENRLETRLFLGPACRNRRLADPFIQHVMLRSPEAVHPYPAPETVLILLSPPAGHGRIDYRGFQSAYAFSPDPMAGIDPVPDENGVVRLPCPVNTGIFFPPESPPANRRVLVIGCGDPDLDALFIRRLGGTGITECALFDPCFETNPLADPQPPGLDVQFVGAAPPEDRARLFRSCSAAVVASPEIGRDNHFLQESLACGAISLAFLAGNGEKSAWPEAALQQAVGKWLQTEISPRPPSPPNWPEVFKCIDRPAADAGRPQPLAIHGHRLTICRAPEEVNLLLSSGRPPGPALLCLAAGSRAEASPDLLELANGFDQVHLYAPENSGFRRLLEDGLTRQPILVHRDLEEHLRGLLSSKAPPLDLQLLFLSVPQALSTAFGRELAIPSDTRPRTSEGPGAKRRILLRQSRPMTHTGNLPAGFVGSQVISQVIAQGLVAAARDRFALRWFDLPLETTQLYFRPPAKSGPAGEDDRIHYQQLPRLLESGEIDLMYSSDPDVNWSIRARQLWASKPVPFAGLVFATENQLVTDQLTHLLLSGPIFPFDRFISPTACGARSWSLLQQAIEDWLARHDAGRPVFRNAVSVLPFGIETSQFQGLDRWSCRAAMNLPREAHVILSVGRYSRLGKADLLPLLIACGRLLAKGHDIHLVLCGGGDAEYIVAIERMAARLGLTARVQIHRFIADSEKLLLYGAADQFVSVADNPQETYGVVILEAMAAGLPVVASEWNGYRELVRHGITGFLVPTYWTATTAEQDRLASLAVPRLQNTRDLHESLAVDIPALTEHLETLILNSELRRNFGEAGRRLCLENYDNVSLGKKLLDLLNESIDQARGAIWPPPGGGAPPFVDRLTSRFDHFATWMVKGNEWIVPAPGNDQTGWQRLMLELMTVADEEERHLIEALQAEVARSKRLTITALSERILKDWPYNETEVRQRILRCVKYGLLELHKDRE